MKGKRVWRRQHVFPRFLHSFSPSIFLLHHPSLIVFTQRYLCFGPQGADIVSIPTSQTERQRETLSFLILSIPQHLLRLPFWTVSHYNFSVLLEEVHYLLSSLPLHLCVCLLWELTISPSHLFFFSPWLSLIPPLLAPVPFTSTSVCLLWCILHSSIPYPLLLPLSRTPSFRPDLSYLILSTCFTFSDYFYQFLSPRLICILPDFLLLFYLTPSFFSSPFASSSFPHLLPA